MNNQYLIPANSKRSQLIFNFFRPVDLIVFATGAFISLMLLLIIPSQTLKMTVVKLLPLMISLFLVAPIPNYQNVMVFLRELILFYMNRRIYLWKGWCILDESKEEKE